MNFLNSLPLWAGLAALGAAVPVLIHLWSRSQKFETPWAAMELLNKALIARSQKIQIEDLLLLVLRCLAFILVALAMLRPVLNLSANTGIGGRSVGVVIAVDASYSMNHGEHSRFEKAIDKTQEVLSTLAEGDPVTIVLMSRHPQVLFRRTGYNAEVFDRGLKELAKASPYPLNLERNLADLRELVAELKTATRECYIITDGQVRDWQSLSDKAQESLHRLGDQARLVLAPVAADEPENLAITEFAYSAGSLQRDGSARFAAGVRNTGNQTVDGATVEFYADGKLKSRQDVGRLDPGQGRSVSFFTSFASAGDIPLTARLSTDDLLDDNDRHLIAGVRSSIRVLCIDGDVSESTRSVPRGGYYAVRALRLKHHDENAPIKVVHVDASDSSREKLSDYDVVVMINVSGVSEEMGTRLHQFAAGGGGLMIFLGDKVDLKQYNRNLTGKEHPVLPARLVEVVEHVDASEGWQIAPLKSDHALARVVDRVPADITAVARFHKVVRTEPFEGGESILALDGGRMPLLLTHTDARADRVLLCTSSVDRSWNNFPEHPLFTILLQQAVTMLSRRPKLDRDIVGEPAIAPLPGRMVGDEVIVTDPQGKASPVKVSLVRGATACVFTPETPGIYRVADRSGHHDAAVAASVDTIESDVRAADVFALKRWVDGVAAEVVPEGLAASALNGRTGRDLSLLLLTAGIVCFVGQGLLANYLSRRKHADDGDVVASLQDRRIAASRRY